MSAVINFLHFYFYSYETYFNIYRMIFIHSLISRLPCGFRAMVIELNVLMDKMTNGTFRMIEFPAILDELSLSHTTSWKEQDRKSHQRIINGNMRRRMNMKIYSSFFLVISFSIIQAFLFSHSTLPPSPSKVYIRQTSILFQ